MKYSHLPCGYVPVSDTNVGVVDVDLAFVVEVGTVVIVGNPEIGTVCYS